MSMSWVNKRSGFIVLGVLVALLIVACGRATPTPTPTTVPTNTPVPTATPVPPTPTPVPPTATPPPTPTLPPVMSIDTPTPPPPTVQVTPPRTTAPSQDSRPPHVFIGTATINGSPAPAGTAVIALIDGVEVDREIVQDEGKFDAIFVANPGRTVTFRIGTLNAAQSFTAEVGGADIVTLTATN